MRRLLLLGSILALAACHPPRYPYATTNGALKLSKVVLYRNGVGYFERVGHVDGDTLTLRVRKDQVNDLLKSLTVVERAGGRAVSISMPLDPRAWANAASATLGPGNGSLAEVLDKLRGTYVTLRTSGGRKVEGRILIVEAIQQAPGPIQPLAAGSGSHEQDYKVTLIDGEHMAVVRLSQVAGITLHNGDVALQFERSLDAAAGEGMFQQVDVTIRLAGRHSNDLIVSYVVAAPMWKPTYRVVLPEHGKGQALLQGWAVVDNTTGEDWRDVQLALTAGAPIAFRYDLHTPRQVERADLSEIGSEKHAEVSVGEAGYGQPVEPAVAEAAPPPLPPPAPASAPSAAYGGGRYKKAPAPKPEDESIEVAGSTAVDQPAPVVDAGALARSMQANTHATAVSGLTRYDLDEHLTVPDGTSTMVAIINANVDGEETFMYRPGGAGQGYEANPYRVIRFKNSTPFALESGPISIYSGGSFVGEGISEPVSSGVDVTIPFAVESSLLVAQQSEYSGDEMLLVKIARGVLEVETFARHTTTWKVTSQQPRTADTVIYVRQPRSGGTFELAPRPPGTEDLPDAYLIPVKLAAGQLDAKLDVVEQTPSRTTLSIWDGQALSLLTGILASGNLDPAIRAKLEPIVKLRQEVARIDTEIDGKTRTRAELDQRAAEARANLQAIKKDPRAADLRKKLSDRLDQFTKDADKLGRDLVDLQTQRTEKKIALDDAMQNLELSPREPLAPKK